MERSDYISVEEATRRIGVARGTMHYYLRTLGIETKKFKLDRRAYILRTAFEEIQRLRREAGKNTAQDESASQPPVCSVKAA